MKIINQDDATFTLSIIPRYYNTTNAHTVLFTNEDTNVSTDLSYTLRTIADGYIVYTITTPAAFVENQTYSLKITDDVTTNVIWRGKAFTTAQVTQEYKIYGG